MLKEHLRNGGVHKLVCGAGNEDADEIFNLVRLFSLADWHYFDIAANEDTLLAAKEALHTTGNYGYINVSLGIKGDPHANKASIDYNRCINCMKCIESCPNSAINTQHSRVNVIKGKCIGCGRCTNVCPMKAITTQSVAKPVDEVLPPLIHLKMDSIELHMVGDPKEGLEKWNQIQDIFPGIMSMCMDRSVFSDKALIEQIRKCIVKRDAYTTIVQADGCPMGASDQYDSTLQAVAIGQIVNRAKLPVFTMLSGGTNQYTKEFAYQFDVTWDGIAYGTYARNLIRPYLSEPKLFDTDLYKEAVALIHTKIGADW